MSPLPPLKFGKHAADVRVFDTARKEPARLHHLVAGVVDGGGIMIDTSHQRDFIHHRWSRGKISEV